MTTTALASNVTQGQIFKAKVSFSKIRTYIEAKSKSIKNGSLIFRAAEAILYNLKRRNLPQ